MRKKIALFSFALIAISFASCKKDRVCTCTWNDGSPGATSITTTITLKKVSKGSAKAACMSSEVTPSGQPYTETTTCSLK